MDEDRKDKSFLFKLFQGATAKNRQAVADVLGAEKQNLGNPVESVVIPEIIDREVGLIPAAELVLETQPDGQPENDQAPEKEHSPEDIMKVPHNYLEALRCGLTLEDLLAFEASGAEPLAYFSDFTQNGEEPEQGKKVFLKELQATAKGILEVRKSQAEEVREAEAANVELTANGAPEEAAKKPEPVNGHVCIKVPTEKMGAWLFAFPPENGGKDITEDLIINALNECHIVYGVDETMIKKIAYQRIYLKVVEVAHGTAPIDGTDGIVTDHFPRIQRSSFEGIEDSDSQNIDFKNLNWLHPIAEGDVICDLVFHVESQDGHLVTGEAVKGRVVEKIVIPNGTNIAVNKERTQMQSKINGTLYFDSGKFHVKDVLNIMSDVDLTVGNINTIGNLDIKGDVLSGFKVQATGNIIIRGMVGNSIIKAGGDVKINMGIRGNGEALVDCGGMLDCVYLENCTARVHGAIHAGSIINSDVISDDFVECKKIVGGSVSALNRITTKVIGNNQHRPAVFNLGITQQTLHGRVFLERRSKELVEEIAQTTKNLRFLNSKRRMGDKDQETFNQLTEKSKEMDKEYREVLESLEEIQVKISEFSECELQAQSIFPPVTVTIRSDAVVIEREMSMCRVWSDNGEIRMS